MVLKAVLTSLSVCLVAGGISAYLIVSYVPKVPDELSTNPAQVQATSSVQSAEAASNPCDQADPPQATASKQP